MKKFTVIGANSSLARNFLYYLRDKDVRVKVYDIQEKQLDGVGNYERINFLDKQEVLKIDFDCDAVFVFTGLIGAATSVENANLFIDVNEKVLVNILDAVKEKKAGCRIIYPSSRLVYKDKEGALSETDELEPKSIYAQNKIFAENCLKIYGELYGIDYTILRIAIPFGELNPSAKSYGIIAKLISQSIDGEITLFGDGSGVRTFTHIKNICEAFYEVSGIAEARNQIYNLGGNAYSFAEISEMLARKNKCKIKFIEWTEALKKVEVKNGRLNSSKLDKLIGITYIDINTAI